MQPTLNMCVGKYYKYDVVQIAKEMHFAAAAHKNRFIYGHHNLIPSSTFRIWSEARL